MIINQRFVWAFWNNNKSNWATNQSAQPLNRRTTSMIWPVKQWEQAPTLILPISNANQWGIQAQPTTTPRKPHAINSTKMATPGTVAANSNQSCRHSQWISPTVVLHRLSPKFRTKVWKSQLGLWLAKPKILMATAKQIYDQPIYVNTGNSSSDRWNDVANTAIRTKRRP